VLVTSDEQLSDFTNSHAFSKESYFNETEYVRSLFSNTVEICIFSVHSVVHKAINSTATHFWDKF